MENSVGVLVSICCMVYNHEDYLEQCLNGFVSQKTNFKFEILINDDASTDNSSHIIKRFVSRYSELFVPFFHEKNEYTRGVNILGNLFKKAKGKYIAFCEGDDYWIDENKLQKQVDYLEKHQDVGFVRTDYNIYYQRENRFEYSINKQSCNDIKDTFEDYLVNAWFMAPCTTMYRRCYTQTFQNHNFFIGTLPIVLEAALDSKIAYLPEVTTVYRVLENSASHFRGYEKKIAFIDGVYSVQLYYLYKSSRNDLLDEILKKRFISKYNVAFAYRRRKEAVRYLYAIEILKCKETIEHKKKVYSYLFFRYYYSIQHDKVFRLFYTVKSWAKKIIGTNLICKKTDDNHYR